jgi:hypothetical protein
VISDEPAVMLQIHAGDPFLIFIKAAGRPRGPGTPTVRLPGGAD